MANAVAEGTKEPAIETSSDMCADAAAAATDLSTCLLKEAVDVVSVVSVVSVVVAVVAAVVVVVVGVLSRNRFNRDA